MPTKPQYTIAVTGEGNLQTRPALVWLGQWAATPCDHKQHKVSRRWSLATRYVLTHVPSGLRATGSEACMTAREVCGAVAALASVVVNSDADLIMAREAIYAAHPARVRAKWSPAWLKAGWQGTQGQLAIALSPDLDVARDAILEGRIEESRKIAARVLGSGGVAVG